MGSGAFAGNVGWATPGLVGLSIETGGLFLALVGAALLASGLYQLAKENC